MRVRSRIQIGRDAHEDVTVEKDLVEKEDGFMNDNDTNNPANKRNYLRVEAEIPVRIEFENRTIKLITKNISCGGMFLKCNEKTLQKNKELTAYIGTGQHGTDEVKTLAQVRRVEKTEQGAVCGVAMEFTGLRDEEKETLEHVMRWRKTN